ncbi:MAG: hypothetical protein JWQ35_500 [Bacteriovoracaceae bacterium]|nr:hypothetical protein [Bacteriovoracaceae bacterium]
MKRRIFQSLKFDLLFDLSLLTFCALVLSQGLLIVLFRTEFPRDIQGIAKSVLKPLHQGFLNSKNFRDAALTDPKNVIEIENAFESFLISSDLGGNWGKIRLEVVQSKSPIAPSGEIIPIERPFLLFIPTIYEFQYLIPTAEQTLFNYHWSIEPFQDSLTRFKYRAFLMTLLIEAILVMLGYFLLFRRNVLVPIHNLAEVSQAFLAENWSARCAVERRDELGDVSEALNEMAGKIQEKEKKLVLSIESLKRANEEIEAAQNEQLQIEKLASIGRLAAGVAHEVGNPLGAISGYIDILRTAMTKAKISREDIELCDRIESETNRISKIIRALLQQARPPKDRITNIKLKPVLVRSVQLAQIPSSIDLSFDIEDEEAEVLAEEDQLVQIFLNLLVNSRHAIESRKEAEKPGTLRIRCVARRLPIYRGTASEGGDFDTSIVRSLKPETYWVVSIEDNGVGISETDQKKLFEPFFSTKAPGKGTGLGLYVTKSIVESFRGAIVVRSAINYGAAFSVFLPKSKGMSFAIET